MTTALHSFIKDELLAAVSKEDGRCVTLVVDNARRTRGTFCSEERKTLYPTLQSKISKDALGISAHAKKCSLWSAAMVAKQEKFANRNSVASSENLKSSMAVPDHAKKEKDKYAHAKKCSLLSTVIIGTKVKVEKRTSLAPSENLKNRLDLSDHTKKDGRWASTGTKTTDQSCFLLVSTLRH